MRGKNIENRFPPPSQKKDKLCLEMLKTKSCLITSNWQKNMLWVIKISFLAIPMLTSQKLLQKGGSGQKCCLFVTKIVILKS